MQNNNLNNYAEEKILNARTLLTAALNHIIYIPQQPLRASSWTTTRNSNSTICCLKLSYFFVLAISFHNPVITSPEKQRSEHFRTALTHSDSMPVLRTLGPITSRLLGRFSNRSLQTPRRQRRLNIESLRRSSALSVHGSCPCNSIDVIADE